MFYEWTMRLKGVINLFLMPRNCLNVIMFGEEKKDERRVLSNIIGWKEFHSPSFLDGEYKVLTDSGNLVGQDYTADGMSFGSVFTPKFLLNSFRIEFKDESIPSLIFEKIVTKGLCIQPEAYRLGGFRVLSYQRQLEGTIMDFFFFKGEKYPEEEIHVGKLISA